MPCLLPINIFLKSDFEYALSIYSSSINFFNLTTGTYKLLFFMERFVIIEQLSVAYLYSPGTFYEQSPVEETQLG